MHNIQSTIHEESIMFNYDTLSVWERDVIAALIARQRGEHGRMVIREFLNAFDGQLDAARRWTLHFPSSNSVRLLFNKGALPYPNLEHNKFIALCESYKRRLVTIANLYIMLDQEKLIIPEYRRHIYFRPCREEMLPWRTYTQFYTHEITSICYAKSFIPIPALELCQIAESAA
jgi:hypothetical protein